MIHFRIQLYEDSPIGDNDRVPTNEGELFLRASDVSHVWEDDDGVIILVVAGKDFVIVGETIVSIVCKLTKETK